MDDTRRKEEAAALLRAGIAAAKAGKREEAHGLLQHAVEKDEGNLNAWLWLSSVVDDAANRQVCLRHALALDPENEAARRGLETIHRQQADELLQAGIAAAKQGQRDHARKLLTQVVDQDEKNVNAWLWLSGLVASLDERELCLENVLTIDPGNEAAQRGLEQVREQKEAQATARAEAAPVLTRVEAAPFSTLTIPEDDWTITPSDEFENPYLCPVCATETRPEDKKCPACGTGLWLKQRKREQRSVWLWIATVLQIVSTLEYAASFYLFFIVVGLMAQIDNAGGVLAVYLGQPLPADVSPEQASMLLDMLPPLVFFIIVATLLVTFLYSLFVLIGMFMRWKWVWYLLLVSAGLQLVFSLVGSIQAGLFVALCGSIPAFLMVLVVFQMQDDFFYDYTRVLLKPDREARSGIDYLSRGRHYAKNGLWAMAVVHLQRAAGAMGNQIEPQLMLAWAYLELKRYERAAQALAEARRISPEDPRVADLAADLEKARGTA